MQNSVFTWSYSRERPHTSEEVKSAVFSFGLTRRIAAPAHSPVRHRHTIGESHRTIRRGRHNVELRTGFAEHADLVDTQWFATEVSVLTANHELYATTACADGAPARTGEREIEHGNETMYM